MFAATRVFLALAAATLLVPGLAEPIRGQQVLANHWPSSTFLPEVQQVISEDKPGQSYPNTIGGTYGFETSVSYINGFCEPVGRPRLSSNSADREDISGQPHRVQQIVVFYGSDTPRCNNCQLMLSFPPNYPIEVTGDDLMYVQPVFTNRTDLITDPKLLTWDYVRGYCQQGQWNPAHARGQDAAYIGGVVGLP